MERYLCDWCSDCGSWDWEYGCRCHQDIDDILYDGYCGEFEPPHLWDGDEDEEEECDD